MFEEASESILVGKLAAAWPADAWRDVTVLVAVSGGADSVALARALSQLRVTGEGRLVLAHFNHGLRGDQSDADQRFVEDLARELGTPFIFESAPAAVPPSEASLRDLRYDFLKAAASQSGARYVATAHTADDQVETVLLNILRGTGLAGLAGIPRFRPLTEAATLVRPLLDVTRAEVLAYLALLDKPFREDASNASTRYTRNRIRHELLPLLEREYNPGVRGALTRLGRLAREGEAVIGFAIRHELSKLSQRVAGGIELDSAKLQGAPEAVAREILIEAWKWQGWPLADMGLDRWDEFVAFARLPHLSHGVQSAPWMLPGGIRAEKQGGVLRLTRPLLNSNRT